MSEVNIPRCPWCTSPVRIKYDYGIYNQYSLECYHFPRCAYSIKGKSASEVMTAHLDRIKTLKDLIDNREVKE